MARILITTNGSLGDVHPCMGVAKELQRRGHTVTLATAQFHGEYVKAAGIPFAPIRPALSSEDPEIVRAVLDPKRGAERLHREYIFPHFDVSIEDLLPLAREADVILGSVLMYPIPIVSKLTGVPWVASLLSPMTMWSGYEPPILTFAPWLGKLPLPPAVHRLIFKFLIAFSYPWTRPWAKIRREHGLDDKCLFLQAHLSPWLSLCHWSREFGDRQPDWRPTSEVTGFVFYDPNEGAALSKELDAFFAKGPTVVFTMGSTVVASADEYLKLFQETAKLLGGRAVITVGRKLIDKYRALSNDSLFFTDYAPYGTLFPRAALVVHQGGVGTTAQVMRAGKPQVILSGCTDQCDNAYRVDKRGLGREIYLWRATPELLAGTIKELLADSKILARAKEVGGRMAQEDGARGAADALETLISNLAVKRKG